MPLYQISYVVRGGKHPGAILLQEQRPQVGDEINLGGVVCVIEEVIDLLPPQGGVVYLHVTCRLKETPPEQTTP